MKKIRVVLLSVLFLCCVAIGLTGCKTDTHTHAFNKQVVTDAYKAAEATCTEKAKYYYSCECGEKGTETFKVGEPLGHEFTNYVSDGNATYEKDGTKTAHCNHTDCTVTDTITDKGSKLESKMSFKTLSVGEKNMDGNIPVYGKVPNAQKTYSFIDEIEIVGIIKYVVSLDVYGIQQVATKTIPLNEGDNTVYIIEQLDGNPKAIYEVTIRRIAIYTVSFNTNGGTAVSSQKVEEGSLIVEPTTERKGYTFIGWNYDFSQPIIKDTTITATWSPNTDTPYKVEYYLENIEDNNYTLYETLNLQGTTDAIATAEQKTYEHFTFDEHSSTLSSNIASDGNLVLKLYYKRNTYTLYNENTSYGNITNATNQKYGATIKCVATEYLGCEFVGWFKDENLLSSEKEYTFKIESNVIAKFKVKDEMSNFYFESYVDTCKITGLKDKTASEIIIPAYVTSIGQSAFSGCSGLTSITIPDSVTSIGEYTFKACSGLTSVTIGSGVTSIGDSAFRDCSGLTSVTIGNSVTSIGELAFFGCSRLENIYITDLTAWCNMQGLYFLMDCGSGNKKLYLNNELITNLIIPDSVTSIGDSAFFRCRGLTSVIIGNSVTSIGNGAFYDCEGLTSIIIGNSVTSIGTSAFYGCSGLTSITIPDSVTSIGNYAFYDCSRLENIYITDLTAWCNMQGLYFLMNYGSGNKKLYLNNELITNLVIPDGVTSIGERTFSYCRGLTSVIIGNSVTYIGEDAFSGCSRLTSVIIDNSVTSIGNGAFSGCEGLTSITIPDSVTSIGQNAFNGCSGLINVTIGNSVTSIGNYAFLGCSGLTSVTIGNSVISIGERTFYGCEGLTSIIIPDSVTSIGNGAFSYCRGLTSITIPDSVTSIGKYALSGCSGFKSITIPDSVTSIGEYALSDCSGLKSITIPDSVTTIGEYAFNGCSGLETVFYKGTVKQWNQITIRWDNDNLIGARRYYYSENEPALNSDGTAYDNDYWHYDVDGKTPVIWKKEN